jgi:multisubunit Na+/H+ antiporter MnhB subunit
MLGEAILQYLPSRGTLWIIFLVIAGLSTLVAIILAYHWQRYGQELSTLKIRMNLVQLIFYIGVGAFLLLMALAILLYPQ